MDNQTIDYNSLLTNDYFKNILSTTEHSPPASEEDILKVEKELNKKLPEAYKKLVSYRNGGSFLSGCYPRININGEDDLYFVITDFYGIEGIATDAIEMTEEWEYEKLGLLFGDTPSGGHTGLMFDYTNLNTKGEPSIVLVHNFAEEEANKICDSFEEFLVNLIDESDAPSDGLIY